MEKSGEWTFDRHFEFIIVRRSIVGSLVSMIFVYLTKHVILSTDLQRFRNECVAAHNFYRASHGTPPICWSTKLAESAQNWAEHLASTTGSVRYSSVKGVGENLLSLWGSELNGQKVIRIWYEEGQHFNFKSPRVTSRTRSFCQVVWEGTREFGAGAALTKHGKQIIVARYFPPLNKKDVAKNVKSSRKTQEGEKPLAYDTRWSRLYAGLKEFHEECLSSHNEYRIRHGAPPLHWSAELAWEAQQWAENLVQTGELRHNEDDTVGENLAGMTGGELSGREAVDMWYEEIENYNFDCHGYGEDTSNFTQVVWVASESLGVGRALEGDLCVVVAFYEPPGNMEGSFSNNVLRMGSTVRQRKNKLPKSFIPPPPDLEGFRLECLVTHNYFRARHGSPPLVLSSTLTDEAQYWAERLLVTGAMEGLDNSRIGISVAVLDGKLISGIKLSELWYKQIQSYDFDSPGFSTETLDFSQLVWTSSRKFGVGKATGGEGVTVVVARYEPVGNIDGLFVQNVKRRGHERGGCEPMIFKVECNYRCRTDSKSTNSVLSWEHEVLDGGVWTNQTPACVAELVQSEKSPTCYTLLDFNTDLNQIDENKNILHKSDEEEPASSLNVSDAFNRLVWIDPNSPTFQRKGVAQATTKDEHHDDADDEYEGEADAEVERDEDGIEGDWVEQDARMVHEQENRLESIDCVAEELYAPTEESRVEEADLFSDPEDDLHHRICEVQRSLSLDSEGTEPEAQAGNVLSKVAFFETFQRSFEAASRSNSQSSFRRSLIEDKPEEWSCTPGQEVHREEEEEYDNEEEQKKDLQQEQDEPECQLEFDDLFPAHVEGDETEAHEDMFEDEGGADEESLVSVSDTEDLADFGYYDDRPEGVQDYELQDTRFETVEFVEDDPSAMEIFEFSDEDASHQYSDVTEHEGKPNLLKPTVLTPMNLDSASECSESQSCETCEHERADVIEDHPYSCDEESFETSEADVEIPGHLSSRTSDPDQCVATAKREDVDIRLKELISNFGLLPVDESPKESDELSDFNETKEGQLVQNILSSKADVKLVEERTPIDEIYEASNKCTVESEIDFDELVTRIERKETEYDDVGANEDGTISDTSKETEKADSVDIVYASVRDHEKECDDEIERVSSELGLEPPKSSKQKNLNKLAMATDVILEYESQLPVAQDGMEPVSENVEAVERRLEPENASDPETLLDRLQSATQEEEVARHEVINDGTSESSKSIESFDVVIRDHLQERESILEEFGLVRVSPDISSIGDEPTEPLPYEHTPQLNFQELPEVTEDISAEVREEVRSEINFEELFSSFGENRDISTTKESPDTYHFDTSKESFVIMGEEKPYESVWRDLDNERGKDLDKIAFQLDVVADSSKEEVSCDSIEPLPYSLAPKASPEKEVSEVSESITTEVRRDVRCQINFEEAFRNLEEDDSVQEDSTQDNQLSEQVEEIGFEKTSDVALDDKKSAMGDEAVLIPPSSPQRISYEGKNYYPAEQVREQKRLSSLYSEEITIGKDETVETPFSARHRATDGENLGHPDIAYKSHRLEKEIESAPSADDKHEVVTEVLSEHIVLQSSNTGSSEEIDGKIHTEKENQDSFPSEDDNVIEEMKPVVYCSSHPVVNEFDDATQLEKEPLDSMAHEDQFLETIAGEALAEKTEIDKQAVDEKHALLFTEEAATVNDVSTDVSSFGRNDAECVQNEKVEEINAEEIDEKEEENSTVNVVAPETQSLLESVSGVTQHTESFDEINKEPSGESKEASMSFEEAVTVREVTSDIPSSPRDVPGENQNIESFDEIDEEPSEESKQASLYLDEAVTLHEVATDAHSSQKDVSEKSRNVESFEEIDQERSKESRKACMSFEEAAALDEATRDTPSAQKHVNEEGQNVESLKGIDVKPSEEREEESTSLKEAVALDEGETDIPTSPKHVSEERQNVESFKEIDEEASEDSKQASMSFEKSVNLEDETSVITTSPKQVSGEIKDLEGCEESSEGPIEESKQALMSSEEAVTLNEVTSNTSYSPRKLSGETQNMESFEEVDEESTEESKQASMSFEEAVTLHEVRSNAPSSPRPLSEESQNEESFVEIDEEQNEECKEATMSFEEAVTLHEVTSNAPSSPKPLSEGSQNEESFEEIDEERNEESKEATMSFEEAVTLREVTSNAPSSPKPLSKESQNEESFEEIDEERNEESKEATMSFEDAVTLHEVTCNVPSSPKPLSEESQNEESFEEIDEERNEESKEATMSFEEAVTLREVTSNVPSSPKPLSEESQNEEGLEEIDEERNEESKEATMSFEEAVTLREVTSNAPSSPKPLSKESQNEESFEEIDEERNEESKEATMSFEDAVTLHEVTCNVPSSPKPLSEESQNEESFEEIDEERNEESKEATMSFEEAVTLREVTSNVPSSPKPLSEESQNEEGLEEIDEERNEESKEATMSFEDAVTLHEGKRDALSSPKDGSEENQNKESLDEIDDEEPTEESKEASMSLEEAVTLGEVKGDSPSSPKRESEESQNAESCEDVKRELIEETLEVTDGDESPESDYGEMFEEFEHSYDTAEFAERAQTANVAGEIGNVANNSNEIEEVVLVEEDLEFEESHETVTTTDALETPQCPLHIAGEVSNKERKEESSEEEQAVKEAFAGEFQDEMTHTSVFNLKSPQSLLRIAAEALENKIDSARQDSIVEETLAAEAEQPGRTEGRANLQQAFSETIPADADVVGELDDSSQHEEAGQTEVTSEQSPADFEETTDTERDASVPIILVDIAAEVSEVEDENLVFVELESQKDSEEVTETQDCCEEAVKECPPDGQESSESQAVKQDCREKTVMECAPDGQETSESQAVKQDCREEAVTECAPDGQETSESQAVKQDCREEAVTERPLDDQEISGLQTVKQDCWEEAVSECAPDGQETSESQAVAEVCLSELSTLQEDKMESRETVEPFEESLPSQLKSEELGLQELHKEKNDKGLVQDDVEEPLQGHKVWQHLETNAEFSDLSFTDDGIVEEEEQEEKEEEELSQRDFAERFIDIGGLNDETTGKDYSRSQQEYFKEIQPWDETADSKAQEFEREENLVTIERSSTERKAIVLTYSEGASVQKEMEILEYSKQVESNTEQQIVEKREVTQVQKFSLNGEKKQAFPEHSSQSLGDKESFSVCQTESLIVSERERHLKLSHEKEEKVEVFSTRTGQTASHVAVEFASTSTTLEYRFESNGACISRQVSSSNDNLSESILDTEIKDHEVEKFEKVLSEEETEVRLLKTEVLELKAAEHQESLPLENPHVTVERETTLVKTVVLKPSAEEAQEEVLMEEDRVTAILREDEAMLEEESTGELFEEEIDIMRMDEALSEEEFRGEGAESNELGQSRSSRVDSVGEVNKGGPFESSGEGEEGDMQNHTVLHLEGEEQSQEKIDDTDALHGSLEEFVIVCASKDSLVEISKEELEGTDLKESAAVAEEELEIVEEDEARTETPVFEEELEVLALSTGKDIIYVECTEEDNLVEHSAVYEEELEVSALKGEGEPAELELEPVTEQEEDDVNRRAVYEEELEMTAYEAQHEAFDEARQIREENEGEGPYAIEDQRNEGLDRVPHENEGAELAVEEEIEKKCDAEENLENVATIGASRQPLDLTQVDFYDQEESVTSTRYYVELSSTESLEPHYVEVDEEEAPYTETYVRQGEPLEENLEEFILVRYGDEFESSGEEDISDHREIYVIPEEENDVENHKFAGTAALAGEPVPESLYEEGFQNMGLGEIRESPEFDMDDSDELDEEEQRQLEEYERLESFVILEEKLSQVESDDDENGDLPMVEGDESVFHLDAHSSGEETLHEDELRETLTAGSLRQKTAFTETQRSQEEDMPQGGDCMHMVDDDIEEQQETPKECSPETEEPQAKEGFSFSEGSKTVSPAPTEDTKMKTDTEAPKGTFELSSTREERAEHNLSSDSSGEQCVSNDGSVSSSASLGDLEGLDSFEQDCLLQHNLYRRQHRVKPLKWSEEQAEGAKRWAEHLASINSLESFDGKDVGENIMSMQGKQLSGSETADLWYKEAVDFNFEDPAFNAKCGRFSQVVWASSREFGVARCVAEDGTEYIVARYKPAGNILGEFKENIKPVRDTLRRRRSSARRRSNSGAPLTPAEKGQ
ncbi:Golgi-associated plant pathogenesis-related protein 1 [Acropora cervicornis]|uniref:Golgi-associated plant pathogenesis-related protein 1 n=1 Tax=Acropora cervicornis TaxID=6130 RepID=A0AAD9VA65_ACRCE|nr:Golgi-associated plant pathogenesis-related protein 1 [Acropora cervicornis]